jgi:hypothetical protein
MLVIYNGTPLKLAEIQHNMEQDPDIPERVIKEITERCVWAAGWSLLAEQPDTISVDRLSGENDDEPGYIPAKDSGLSTELFGFQVTWTTEDDGMCAPIYRHQIGGEFEVWL